MKDKRTIEQEQKRSAMYLLIDSEIKRRFKMSCTAAGIAMTKAIEQLMVDFVSDKEQFPEISK